MKFIYWNESTKKSNEQEENMQHENGYIKKYTRIYKCVRKILKNIKINKTWRGGIYVSPIN